MTSELTILVSDIRLERLLKKLLRGGQFSYSVDVTPEITWEDLTLADYRAMIRTHRPSVLSKAFQNDEE